MAVAPEPADLATRFEAAVQAAKQVRTRPDNQTLLKLYAYYKQATEGDASGERPGAFDFVRGAKFDAWAKLNGSGRDDAMRHYITEVDKLDLNRDP